MNDAFEKLQPYGDKLAEVLLQLRGDLADGNFLRTHFYSVDESCLAGNTHHYWLRLGLTPDANRVFDSFASALPRPAAQWLKSELDRKILGRMFSEYSTLIKIPFSVEIGRVGGERAREIALCIKQRLPAVLPYAIFHLEINRLLRSLGVTVKPPNELEFDMLLAHHCQNSIDKARLCYPEVWDEERGHYVLDSRGAQFGKKLVTELKARNLLVDATKFVDVGSGNGVNVFFVNQYSAAHATGIEQHAGLAAISKVLERRLLRLGQLNANRIEFIGGDAFDASKVDLAQYDIFYIYSPLGESEIDIDQVVDGAKPGAVIIFNRLPIRNREIVRRLKNIAGLFAFQKIVENPIE